MQPEQAELEAAAAALCRGPADAASASRAQDLLAAGATLSVPVRLGLARLLLGAAAEGSPAEDHAGVGAVAAIELAHEHLLQLLDRGPARVLAAVAFDRLRVLRGQAQKFGTARRADGAPWPIDPTTTDSERAKWGLPGRARLEAAPFALPAVSPGETGT